MCRSHCKQADVVVQSYYVVTAHCQVILIGIPLEIAWTSTVSWWADWLTCKVMVSLRIFGYFLSGYILMAISMDRFSAIVFPISHRQAWLFIKLNISYKM